MDRKVWFVVHIKASYQATEAIEFALNSLDALGTEVIDFPKQDREIVTVTGYFDLLPDAKLLQDALENGLSIYDLPTSAIVSVTSDEIENTDWLAEWKRHWKPTEIGHFVIAAPWHKLEETDKIIIRIEPNMAFGTGTHETTQLCLKAIEEHYTPSDSFLDVGTGTGILAIAGAKLSAEAKGGNTSSSECAILAVDNDPDAIGIACENAKLNGVEGLIEFQTTTLSNAVPHYDFVSANLTLDVILPILPLLIEKADRVLVLSGILAEQEKAIVDALSEHGFHDAKIACAGEWIAVTVHKDGTN